MSDAGYNQFCPVAKACELLEPRWTLLILCEMWSGSTRFNDIGRGVPGMSPTLLSRRLKDMQISGLIIRNQDRATGHVSYTPTDIARKLGPIVHALGQWAHENIDSTITLQKLDSRLLMWNVRRKIDLQHFPARRSVVQFCFPEQKPENRHYWLIAKPGCDVDLCVTDPGFDVDLFIESELRTMTSVYMGFSPMGSAIKRGEIFVSGDAALAASIQDWMRLSSFAPA